MRARRLMVVGAGSMRWAAFLTWRLMGIDVVLVDGWASDRYEHLVHDCVLLDPRDGSADLDAIRDLGRGCDGVTTLADASQVTAATVAEGLGLPGVGRAAALVARSKLRQRELFEGTGVAIPRWRHVAGPEDVRAFFAARSGPAVLKPVDSAGSAGVLRVDGEQAGLATWPLVRSLSPSRTVVIEDFIEGREVCVDAVVSRGEPVFVSVCEADYTGPDAFIALSARYATRQRDQPAALRQIRSLAQALGVREATVHAEFKIDGDRWTLLETALRPGGALVPEMTERVSGVSLYAAMAGIAFGEAAPMPAARPPAAAFAQVRFLVGSGQVRRYVPPAEVAAGLPDVRIVGQWAGPGRRVRQPVSEEGRAGYAAGWGGDRDRLDAQLREALDRLARGMGLTPHAGEPVAAANGPP